MGRGVRGSKPPPLTQNPYSNKNLIFDLKYYNINFENIQINSAPSNKRSIIFTIMLKLTCTNLLSNFTTVVNIILDLEYKC